MSTLTARAGGSATSGGAASENVAQWGGAPVEPAAPKADGQDNAANVPEVGARLQGLNPGGTWDRLRSAATAITSTFLGFLNTLPYGRHNATPPALADGEGTTLQLDATGQLRVTGSVTTTPVEVGAQNNAWAGVAVLPGGSSAIVDCRFAPFVTVFGAVTAATTIVLGVSQDGLTFYAADTFSVPAGQSFAIHRTIGARFVQLLSSDASTITATVAAKD